MQIFSGSTGYAGFYGPSASGNNVVVTISRSNGTSKKNVVDPNNGFLADTYQIQWGRTVQIKRVFNNNKPVAIVGFGQGTVTLRGLIGTAAGFEDIVGGNSTAGNKDLCLPLLITIDGSGAYNKCTGEGVASETQGGATFSLSGCILSNINITGTIETNSGTVMQQADVTFNIGGFELNAAGGSDDDDGFNDDDEDFM
jgi:hypothetical protein